MNRPVKNTRVYWKHLANDLGRFLVTEDRLLVAQAVFNGQIGEEHLTTEEIDEFCMMVVDVAMEKEMIAAADRGCVVFDGFEEETLH
jgi:hypothetical protein